MINIKSYVREPITNTQSKTFKLIMDFEPKSAYDTKRLIEVIRLYNRSIVCYLMTGKENSGIYGAGMELFGHGHKSTIIRVRPQNKCDNYIVIDGKRKKMETKTNSGQIQDFFNMNSVQLSHTYIHYNLNINVRPSKKNPTGERYLDFVCTLQHFMNRVIESEAWKPNGENKWGKIYNLQGDSAKLYKAFKKDIEDMKVLPFNREMVYVKEDFED